MRDRIWLSYELGEGSDYPGLYRWLRAQQARECGPALASLYFEHNGDLCEDVARSLAESVDLRLGDRVYLMYKDPEDGELTGLFIFGQRQQAPWNAISC